MKWKLIKQSIDADLFAHFNLEITISFIDSMRLTFNHHERALQEECEKSEKLSDKLLWLEHLARKIEAADEARNKQLQPLDF
jgi:hypothetical protein